MKLLDWLDRALVVLAVLALLVMMSLITVSVIGRYQFASPIPDDLVMSEILMVFVAFLPLSYVQARREHVFVTIFTDWMPGSARAALDTFGLVVGAIIIPIIAWAVFTDFQAAWRSGAYNDGLLAIPEWPGRLIVAVGLGLFALRLVIDAVASAVGLATGSALPGRKDVE